VASISKRAFKELSVTIAETLYENAVLKPSSAGYTRGYNDGKLQGIDYTIRALFKDKDGWYDFDNDVSQNVYDEGERLLREWKCVDNNLNGNYTDPVGTKIKVGADSYNPVERYVDIGDVRKHVPNETVAQFISSGLWVKEPDDEVSLESLLEDLRV
jgi:hypothetical protein